jgi:transcriptional regulator with XRE-family HTH domain
MSKLNHINIGINLKRLRKATDLSQDELATLIPISERSIAKIEKGDPKVGVSILNILLDFFDLASLEELSDSDLYIDNDLRKKLAIHHQETHPEYLKSLTKTPRIVYAIDFYLLPSKALKIPMEVKEIREYFFDNFGWDFNPSSVSNALQRKSDKIKTIKLEGTKDNHYSQKDE